VERCYADCCSRRTDGVGDGGYDFQGEAEAVLEGAAIDVCSVIDVGMDKSVEKITISA